MSRILTGRKRLSVRRRFLRSSIVVMQVEIKKDWREHNAGALHIGTKYYWVNATPQDLQDISQMGKGLDWMWSETDG